MGRGRLERGQATVESALVIPVLVLFALLAVQLGAVAVDLVLVHHAAREAARAAAVDPTASAAGAAARRASGLRGDRMGVSLRGGTSPGEHVTAVVTYRSPTDVPLVGVLVPDVSLSAAVTMRVEG